MIGGRGDFMGRARVYVYVAHRRTDRQRPTHTPTPTKQAEKEGFDRVEEVRGLAPGPFRHAREQHLFFSWLGTA